MPNFAQLLKNEIARVARKENRAELAALKKATHAYRSEIAALKRRTQALEQQVRRLGKGGPGRPAAAGSAEPEEASGRAPRFSPKSLASQRRRLGLSAADCGLLVGASGQSVYLWESGKARPRARLMHAIAALRTMGKKQVAARLAELRGG
jgi:DNA-binding XRE family transcriptional regulator